MLGSKLENSTRTASACNLWATSPSSTLLFETYLSLNLELAISAGLPKSARSWGLPAKPLLLTLQRCAITPASGVGTGDLNSHSHLEQQAFLSRRSLSSPLTSVLILLLTEAILLEGWAGRLYDWVLGFKSSLLLKSKFPKPFLISMRLIWVSLCIALIRLRSLGSQRTPPKKSWSRAVFTTLKLTENQVSIEEGKVDGQQNQEKPSQSLTQHPMFLVSKLSVARKCE